MRACGLGLEGPGEIGKRDGKDDGREHIGYPQQLAPDEIDPHAEDQNRADQREIRDRQLRQGRGQQLGQERDGSSSTNTGMAEKMQPLPGEAVMTAMMTQSKTAARVLQSRLAPS